MHAPGHGAAPPRVMPRAPGWALFLDLDGTLCDYELDPAAVTLDAAQREMLSALARQTGGALCVLSGRAQRDLERLLDGLPVRCRGDHGLEAEGLTPAAAAALAEAADTLAALVARHPGTWLERKPAGCALHYRAAPHAAERLIPALRSSAARWPQLRLLEGRCVLELVTTEADKGTALRALMQSAPFAGRLPVAAGDDVTDEDAFAAARELGGFGIAVGPRPSAAARFRLTDSAAFNAWLRGLALAPTEGANA